MKNLLIALFTFALIFPSCRKSETTKTTRTSSGFMNYATITGYSFDMLVCGGVYNINIHGITDSLAQFNTLPAGSGISLDTASFPVNVEMNWHHFTGNMCDTMANLISIDSLKVDH